MNNVAIHNKPIKFILSLQIHFHIHYQYMLLYQENKKYMHFSIDAEKMQVRFCTPYKVT